ncbi:MAG: competence protein ComJ [Ktedonobacterales bacterium]
MDLRSWHITIGINYSQLTICQSDLRSPFNNWTQIHSNQGFTWRSGSVSFRTFDTDNPEASVLVELRDSFIPQPLAVRIIEVPFDVGGTDAELTTPIGESWILDIPPGHYAVYFAIEPELEGAQGVGGGWSCTSTSMGYDADEGGTSESDAVWHYHLTFVPSAERVQAAIIRADKQLSPPSTLLMDAEPA